ncbi:MAG: caspase family protein, partial [Anaerolineales bacterium]
MKRSRLHRRLLAAMLLPAAALALLLLLPGGGRVAVAEGDSTRDLSGSDVTVNKSLYVSGTTNVYSFTVYNGSPDMEFVDGVTLTLPAGWTVTAAQGDPEDSSPLAVSFTTSGLGTNEVSFTDSDGYPGEIHDDCTWSAVVTASAPVTVTGTQTVTWALSGDGYGAEPHYVTGTLALKQEAARLHLPLVFRDYGQKRYAVIVGVADYLIYGPGTGDLSYTDDDARDLRQALITYGGFEVANIKLLIDSQGTAANIEDAITNWLAPRENADDLVVFLFSGHGMDGGYLLPYEYAGPLSTAIPDWELDGWLDALDSENIVVAIDSCFSGDFIGTLFVDGPPP